jgi:hypothetical protein
MRRLVLHIDRLVLTGYPADQRSAIAQALREELGRQLAGPLFARQLEGRTSVARLQAGTVNLAATAAPATVGAAAGAGIARGLVR